MSCECHLFPEGRHGLSLADRETWDAAHSDGIVPAVAAWFELFQTWLKRYDDGVVG
ncbi:hypothetical protein [Lacticaseibacillus mingshuiensis]|uniref:Uncharacterized protein n=1 Tax=Lacticaseibacillus mingshuiensis TaxID=2799574 RepID=A0ABW4CJW4_9LACO|nr:hypothetical protein [Lacticaseibacillus mingshuiensis]